MALANPTDPSTMIYGQFKELPDLDVDRDGTSKEFSHAEFRESWSQHVRQRLSGQLCDKLSLLEKRISRQEGELDKLSRIVLDACTDKSSPVQRRINQKMRKIQQLQSQRRKQADDIRQLCLEYGANPNRVGSSRLLGTSVSSPPSGLPVTATVTSKSGLDDFHMGACSYNKNHVGYPSNDRAESIPLGSHTEMGIADQKVPHNGLNSPLKCSSPSGVTRPTDPNKNDMVLFDNIKRNKSNGVNGSVESVESVDYMFPITGEQLSEVILERGGNCPSPSRNELMARSSANSGTQGIPNNDSLSNPTTPGDQFSRPCQPMTPVTSMPMPSLLTPAPSPQSVFSQCVSPRTIYNGGIHSPANNTQYSVPSSPVLMSAHSPPRNKYSRIPQSQIHSQHGSPGSLPGSPNELSPIPYKSSQTMSPDTFGLSSAQTNGTIDTHNSNFQYPHLSAFGRGSTSSITDIPLLHDHQSKKCEQSVVAMLPSNDTPMLSQPPSVMPTNNSSSATNYTPSDSNDSMYSSKPSQLGGFNPVPPSFIPRTLSPPNTSTSWGLFPISCMSKFAATSPAFGSSNLQPTYKEVLPEFPNSYIDSAPAIGFPYGITSVPGTSQTNCHIPILRPTVSKAEYSFPSPEYSPQGSLNDLLHSNRSDSFLSTSNFSPIPSRPLSIPPLSPNDLSGSFLTRSTLPYPHVERNPIQGKSYHPTFSNGSQQPLGYPFDHNLTHHRMPETSVSMGYLPLDPFQGSHLGKSSQSLAESYADDDAFQRELQNIPDFTSNI